MESMGYVDTKASLKVLPYGSIGLTEGLRMLFLSIKKKLSFKNFLQCPAVRYLTCHCYYYM